MLSYSLQSTLMGANDAMDALQKTVDRCLEELPRVLLTELLDQKLRAQGIKLSKTKREELANAILTKDLDGFEFDDGRKRKRDISIEFTDADSELIERKFSKFMDNLPTVIDGLTNKTAENLLSTLKRRWPREAQAQRGELDRFRKRLHKRWGDGIEKLHMLITIAREYGSDLGDALQKAGGGQSPKTFEILIKLHARACQVAEEIVCLMSNGFADGAMARWRTLHEIVSVGYFIQRHGDELAQRYEHHQVIESRKIALQYQRYQSRLGQRPLPAKTMSKIEADRASLLALYGQDFANSQGWAAKHIGKRDPSIADIQEAVGVDHLAPYYRMASHNVHANPKGIFFKLGHIGEPDNLLAGPSNAGLADPGHATAISLGQICAVLLPLYSTVDTVIVMKVIGALEDEIGAALLAADKKLKADDRIFRRMQRRTGVD